MIQRFGRRMITFCATSFSVHTVYERIYKTEPFGFIVIDLGRPKILDMIDAKRELKVIPQK